MAAFLAIDPAWLIHPKVQAVHKDARSLWIAAGLHAVAAETDGHIQKRMLPLLAAQAGVSPKQAAQLVDTGLWIDHGTFYEIHDFLKYNQSKAMREAQREKWRKAKARAAGIAPDSYRDSTEESDEDSPEIPGGIPRASLPCLALPTTKALRVPPRNPPRNGSTIQADPPEPPEPPNEASRAAAAQVRAIMAQRGGKR